MRRNKYPSTNVNGDRSKIQQQKYKCKTRRSQRIKKRGGRTLFKGRDKPSLTKQWCPVSEPCRLWYQNAVKGGWKQNQEDSVSYWPLLGAVRRWSQGGRGAPPQTQVHPLDVSNLCKAVSTGIIYLVEVWGIILGRIQMLWYILASECNREVYPCLGWHLLL